MEDDMTVATERAVLAGGCFWGVQDLLRRYPGVISTRVGYTGGEVPNATYRNHGNHAEGIEIIFDPKIISYRQLLEFFFQIHDPSTLNRQGNDRGASYRSAIFTTSDEQKKVAEAYVVQLNAAKVYKKPIVTKIGPLEAFYAAEGYHQDYLTLHPNQPYIAFNDIPKVENLKKIFADNYIEKPTLVSSAKVTN
jgi:peptide-methionine (S)-S-oxide reductase